MTNPMNFAAEAAEVNNAIVGDALYVPFTDAYTPLSWYAVDVALQSNPPRHTSVQGCKTSSKKKKIPNASLGSMISNRYALLRRGGGCGGGKRVIVHSDNTVTNNSKTSMLNKELSTIQREVGSCGPAPACDCKTC